MSGAWNSILGQMNTLEQDVQTISQSQDNIIQHYLILLCAPNNIHHHIALRLEHHHSIVVEDHIAGLLRGLLYEAFLKRFLLLDARIRICAGIVVAMCIRRAVRGAVVFR